MRICVIVFCVFLAVCLTACVHQSGESDILAVAKQHALKSGYRIEDFTAKIADAGREEFCVFFTGLTQRPGDNFTVYVNKKSRECRTVEGR